VRSCDRRPLELGTVQGFANVYQGSEQAGDGPVWRWARTASTGPRSSPRPYLKLTV